MEEGGGKAQPLYGDINRQKVAFTNALRNTIDWQLGGTSGISDMLSEAGFQPTHVDEIQRNAQEVLKAALDFAEQRVRAAMPDEKIIHDLISPQISEQAARKILRIAKTGAAR